MGSLRRGLSAAALAAVAPQMALAGVCETVRPGWTPGTPATAWTELAALMGTPVSLALLLLSALAMRLRAARGALVLTLLWTAWISAIAFGGIDGALRAEAAREGCIGSPALFIAAVAALCGAMVFWTTRRPGG